MGDFVTFDMSGDVGELIDEYKEKFPEAVAGAIFESGLDILNRSNELAPRDTNDMRRSGRVNPPKFVAGEWEVLIDYLAPYALRQHETLWYAHPRGGQAKFLETAVTEEADGWAPKILRLTELNLKATGYTRPRRTAKGGTP